MTTVEGPYSCLLQVMCSIMIIVFVFSFVAACIGILIRIWQTVGMWMIMNTLSQMSPYALQSPTLSTILQSINYLERRKEIRHNCGWSQRKIYDTDICLRAVTFQDFCLASSSIGLRARTGDGMAVSDDGHDDGGKWVSCHHTGRINSYMSHYNQICSLNRKNPCILQRRL